MIIISLKTNFGGWVDGSMGKVLAMQTGDLGSLSRTPVNTDKSASTCNPSTGNMLKDPQGFFSKVQ